MLVGKVLCSCFTLVILASPYGGIGISAFGLPRATSESSTARSFASKRSQTYNQATTTDVDASSFFSSEVEIGLRAVRKACVITQKLQREIESIETVTKSDSSPVTVADFASQAVILQHLKNHFPNDIFLAEESSSNAEATTMKLIAKACEGLIEDEDSLRECIDLGQTYCHEAESIEKGTVPPRFWCLDPIDGTKDFYERNSIALHWRCWKMAHLPLVSLPAQIYLLDQMAMLDVYL